MEKRKRGRPRTVTEVPLDFPVILIPVPEPSADFAKRRDEVQRIMAKMILLGRTSVRRRKAAPDPSKD